MKNKQKTLQHNRKFRATRIRRRLRAVSDRPRLSVFRSLRHFRGQVIDNKGTVLAAASDLKLKGKMSGTERAAAVGKALAEKALAKNITAVVFDKGPYTYHGQVKAFADAARAGGLQF